MTGSEDANLGRVLGLGLAVAVLLGVAAAGGSIVRSTSTEATARQAFPYALMGAATAVVLVGIVLVAIRAAKPGALRLRPFELLAIAFIAAAIGSLLGVALTPRAPTPDDVSPLEDEAIDEREAESDQFGAQTRAGPVDADRDGVADRDSNGEVIIAYDLDGDGRLDGYLQPCPPSTPDPEPRPGLTPVDVECDGTVDEWIQFDPNQFLDGDEFLEEPPATVPPQERLERADDEGAQQRMSAIGKLLLGLLAVVVCALIVVWLVRMPDRRRDDVPGVDDDAPDPDQGPPPVDLRRSFNASLDAMLEDPDPRRAICAAYGRLLYGFADVGLARRSEEAPEEHVRRCLDAARVDPGPVRELLGLFALARFSSHPIDESHRIAAVRAMRAALASVESQRVAVPVGAAPPPPGSAS